MLGACDQNIGQQPSNSCKKIETLDGITQMALAVPKMELQILYFERAD